MGLEAVEFVMEVEKEFKISIPDDDVVYFRTRSCPFCDRR